MSPSWDSPGKTGLRTSDLRTGEASRKLLMIWEDENTCETGDGINRRMFQTAHGQQWWLEYTEER